MNKVVVIVDKEQTYARRISDYFSQRLNNDSEIKIFNSESLFINSFKGKKIDILITTEECFEVLKNSEFETKVKVDKLKILTNDDDSEYYKYQSAGKLFELFFRENEHEKEDDETDESSIKEMKLSVKSKTQDKLIKRGMLSDNETLKVIDESISECYSGIEASQKSRLRNQVFYSIRGLDVLEELIADESITEIMVNGENNIFYEKSGRLYESKKCFDSREQLIDIIHRIVSSANRTVNISSPIVDARLQDGSRVNVVLEPVSLDGPILTIRRFPKTPLTAEKLVSLGAVTEEIFTVLEKLVFAGYNILISGSTGSGKTTFLNILTSFISKEERIITIEDSAELKVIGIKNLVRLESRNAGSDGCAEITIRDLIKSALRMRPDRIILGEVRGGESIDMVQAFTVGQDGSMSTIHANSAEDALYRLEMLMMMGSDMPLKAIRRQIATGVDIVIHLGRMKDRSRKLLEIREVIGIENENIITGCLYKYENGCFEKKDEIVSTYKLEKSGEI